MQAGRGQGEERGWVEGVGAGGGCHIVVLYRGEVVHSMGDSLAHVSQPFLWHNSNN